MKKHNLILIVLILLIGSMFLIAGCQNQTDMQQQAQNTDKCTLNGNLMLMINYPAASGFSTTINFYDDGYILINQGQGPVLDSENKLVKINDADLVTLMQNIDSFDWNAYEQIEAQDINGKSPSSRLTIYKISKEIKIHYWYDHLPQFLNQTLRQHESNAVVCNA